MALRYLLLALCTLLTIGICDPCDWNGATPSAYVEYTNECSPHRSIGPEGYCDYTNSLRKSELGTKHPCKSFCQIRTTFVYDNEYPLGGTYAKGWGWFGSSEWMRFGMHWREPIDLPDAPFDVLEEGISGGLSHASRGLAEVGHIDIELDNDQCGYFTFLPMNKIVCGTYSHAKPWPKCDKDRMSKGNMCVEERSNYATTSGFYGWTGQVGEPTVRGHTVFVRTRCDNGMRLSASEQDQKYALAMTKGGALPDEEYEGWRAVWNNDLLYNRFLGGHYGLDDKALVCLATLSESEAKLLDADVAHCWYRIGELMEEPHKTVPIGRNGEQWGDHTFFGGCSVYVKRRSDWSKECKVTYAEVATAATMITFNCLKEQFKKGRNHWGVKGTHDIRLEGDCAAQVVVWGGNGHGINIGGDTEVDYSHLDPLVRSVLVTLPQGVVPDVAFGDPLDPTQPFGPLGVNGTGLQEWI